MITLRCLQNSSKSLRQTWKKGFSTSNPTKDDILRPEVAIPKLQPDLTKELEGLPKLKLASQLSMPHTEETILSNGLRVVSQETYGQAATLGVFVHAGSRFEDESNAGVSHLLEHLCFKSTTSQNHAQIVRDIENLGATTSAMTGREQIIYTMDVLRDNVDKGADLLLDSILNPSLIPEEIEAIKQIMSFQIEHLEEQPQALLQEKILEAAYGIQSPLGRPLYCSPEQIANLSLEKIQEFRQQFFVPSRMIFAGAGVEHERLVRVASEWLEKLPKDEKDIPTVSSSYKGGHVGLHFPDSPLSYASLAFETGGWHDEDLIPTCVLHMLLGGGDSFSAGGPGKGMYSRLYTSVLNRYYWVESASAFTSIHDDAGLLGIFGAASPNNSGNLVAVMCNQMLRVANEPVTSIELSRARNQLKSSVLMNLESRMILYEDIGRQMLTYGKREAVENVCERIDAVTEKDLIRVAQRALSNPPTLVYYGDLKRFPEYEATVQALHTRS